MRKTADEVAQRHVITFDAETGDHAFGAGRDIGMVPEDLAFVDVGNVNLDHRPLKGIERIEDGHRSVGEGPGIDDYARGLAAGFMNPVDQLIFPIALGKKQRVTGGFGDTAAVGLDIRERLVAVDLRLALAEQIEVWAVEDGEKAHATPPPCKAR